ncbi:Rne/Rng family ribonuclease [Fodinisporobacter ferrooxydans]|uniref:Ribonuclease G n=1 Tax=Fodinisporobacter ferrooxydans TaxID=2901836 RepID=A0ABY4CQN5_9BACL|nr:Rne/Rng family ribonuclease [Alicyclobacillaceae bacterium MYW30-H2]
MFRQIVATSDLRETRVAVLEDGKTVEIYVERPSAQRIAGNLYKGRVANVLPGMQAAFVNIGLEKNAFLYIDDCDQTEWLRRHPHDKPTISDLLTVNQEIVVQVSKEPVNNKGARVTQKLTLPGRYVVLMPGNREAAVSRRIDDPVERERLQMIVEPLVDAQNGLIARTAAIGVAERMIREDFKFLSGLWQRIERQIRTVKTPALVHRDVDLISRTVRDLFTIDVDQFITDSSDVYQTVLEILNFVDPFLAGRAVLEPHPTSLFGKYRIDQDLDKALRRRVWLRNGGYLVIDQTEALTVIDVNTGKYTGTDVLETTVRTNLEAAREIARQIRLRDIGGMIVVDFIDMSRERHRQEVLAELEHLIKRDRTKTQIFGTTSLGLVEMTRKKVRQSLDEVLQKTCPYCEGKGKVRSEEAMAAKIERAIREQHSSAVESQMPAAAMFVEAHPLVAAALIGPGGNYLDKLEQDLRIPVYIKGKERLHLRDFKIVPTSSVEQAESLAFPVAIGQVVEVFVEEPHVNNPLNGIARIEGYVIDVEDGSMYVGQRVPVEIGQVYRTYAKGRPCISITNGNR